MERVARANECVACLEHLLAAERLMSAMPGATPLAYLSLVIERLKRDYPEARLAAEADPVHVRSQWDEEQWGSRPAPLG